MTSVGAIEAIGLILKSHIKKNSFDTILKNLKIQSLDIDKKWLTATLTIGSEHLNSQNFVHGGVSATIIDNMSGYTFLLVKDFHKYTIQTINMDIKYIKGIQLGQEVLIETRADKIGKSLAFFSTIIRLGHGNADNDNNNNADADVLVKGSTIFSIAQKSPPWLNNIELVGKL